MSNSKQMYKVFLNDRLLLIGDTKDLTIKSSSQFFTPEVTAEDLEKWFQKYVNETRKKQVVISAHPESFFQLFESIFLNVKAAGGVVRHDERILFIYRQGKWDLPKGKIDPGESPEEAALREVREETGITGHRIVKTLPSTWHIYQSPYKESAGKWILKETYWFEMEVPGMEKMRLQAEEGITDAGWIPVKKLDKVVKNTYRSLKELITFYRT